MFSIPCVIFGKKYNDNNKIWAFNEIFIDFLSSKHNAVLRNWDCNLKTSPTKTTLHRKVFWHSVWGQGGFVWHKFHLSHQLFSHYWYWVLGKGAHCRRCSTVLQATLDLEHLLLYVCVCCKIKIFDHAVSIERNTIAVKQQQQQQQILKRILAPHFCLKTLNRPCWWPLSLLFT